MRSRPFLSLAVLFASCAAAAQAAWQYHLPETGLIPSAASLTYLAPAGERHHGEDSLTMSVFEFTVPFADPRRSQWNDWYINACLDVQMAHFSSPGHLVPDASNYYALTLPVSLIHPLPQEKRLILTLAPHVATDFNGPAHAFGIGGFLDYRVWATERLKLSLGAACMPNESSYWFVPFATAEWHPNDDWTLEIKGFTAQAMRRLSHGVSVGAFARAVGGSWATHGEEGTRLLRVRSLVLGGRTEWDFSRPEESKRILFADVGVSVITVAEKLRFGHMQHADEMHHYHPSLYVSVGADFRF